MTTDKVTFSVKEGSHFKPSVSVEFFGAVIGTPRGKASIYLDLKPGLTLEQAHSVAQILRETIQDVWLADL